MEYSSREEQREEELPFAVCFEVEPTADGLGRYLTLAGDLRPELDRIPGFESIERSRSVRAERRLLSLSYWADEAAVVAWRSHGSHHEAQVIGRNELFADYRLRVGKVIHRWRPESIRLDGRLSAHELPGHRLKPHHEKRLLGLLRIEGLNEADRMAASFANGSVEFERYESMVNPGRTFFVVSLADEDAGRVVETHSGGERRPRKMSLPGESFSTHAKSTVTTGGLSGQRRLNISRRFRNRHSDNLVRTSVAGRRSRS